MPPFEAWERLLGFAIAALSGILAVSLWIRGLAPSYPIFTIFLTFGALRSLFVASVKLAGNTYAYFFIATEVIQITLYFLMVIELYGLVFRQFKGIRVVSRFAVAATLLLALGVSAATLHPEIAAAEKGRQEALKRAQQRQEAEAKKALEQAKAAPDAANPPAGSAARKQPPRNSRVLLDMFLIAERGVFSALVLMIIAMSMFLGWFPIQLPRNVLLHCIVFAAFFLSKASLILYRHIGNYQVAVEWRSASLVCGIVCLLIWIAGLRSGGEATTHTVGIWNRENERELLDQLKGINASLGRLAR